MLSYINEYRSEVGVSVLTLDETLSVAATIRAMELAYTNVEYGHNRPNGSSYATVITEVYGYPSFYGENLAGGTSYSTAKAASEGLKGSSGHYANMINKNFTKVGIGYVYVPFGYRYYWVQLFVA